MNPDLLNDNFNVQYTNALLQTWNTTRQFNCIGNPKKQNLLLYLQGISVVYTDVNGKVTEAHSGDLVYTPGGSQYRAEIFVSKEQGAHTVGINFLLFDEFGEPAVISDDICVFHNFDPQISILFHRALTLDLIGSPLRNKILLLEILCTLAERTDVSGRNRGLEEIRTYIAEHITENPSVSQLAQQYGMSEVSLRKKFREATGMSPVEYRNRLRLSRAVVYLEYGEISVQEISDMLGYATVSHFIKEFRATYGVPPLKYRKYLRSTME